MTPNTLEDREKMRRKSLETYLRHELEKQEDQNSFFKILTAMTIIFLGIILTIFLFADNKKFLENSFGQDSFITRLFVNLTESKTRKEKAEFTLPFGPRKQNILLLGIDSNGSESDIWEGTRTDTIVLLNIDPKTKTLNAISIPRDSKVYLPGDMGVQKINAAHAIGGIKTTIKTVEDTLGVRVDRYIMVHDEAVKKIVEAMDGIDIYVEKDMNYHDYAGKLHINLKKGQQHLSPEQVVGYLRFRHDAMGDIGRAQRQQWLLRGVLEQLQQPKTIAKVPQILAIAKEYVKTDMSLYEMSQYAAIAKHFNTDNIEIATLPGSPNKKGYTSYWILDPDKTQEVVNRLIYRENKKSDKVQYVASIMYSNDNEKLSKTIIQDLEANNVTVKCIGTSNATHAQFIAHSKDVTTDYYNWLKKKVPNLKAKQFVYDPINFYCSDTDFTIIIAGQ
ncbi:MAG: LytR family transcriptional regulator [Cyanobacteria bacterium SIG32]|nr:LytR family transcriptional regulator [Cyanobacteria bacterium SIG32]